jgi:dihydrofolate synthase/folylpolyglutamate synthase
LRNYLNEFVDAPMTMIFGALERKDVCEMLAILLGPDDMLVLTRPDNSRAMPISELADQVPTPFDRDKIILSDSVTHALAVAREVSSADDVILVTGSLYLVGEVKKILNN